MNTFAQIPSLNAKYFKSRPFYDLAVSTKLLHSLLGTWVTTPHTHIYVHHSLAFPTTTYSDIPLTLLRGALCFPFEFQFA